MAAVDNDRGSEVLLARLGAPRVLRVAVASKNPSKLQSVDLALRRLLPGWPAPELIPAPVPSRVSDQPLSASETLSGALNRARGALVHPDAKECEFSVGLEGGVEGIAGRAFESGFIAVVDRAGRTGVGSSARFWLADHILEELKSGKSVDEVDEGEQPGPAILVCPISRQTGCLTMTVSYPQLCVSIVPIQVGTRNRSHWSWLTSWTGFLVWTMSEAPSV